MDAVRAWHRVRETHTNSKWHVQELETFFLLWGPTGQGISTQASVSQQKMSLLVRRHTTVMYSISTTTLLSENHAP